MIKQHQDKKKSINDGSEFAYLIIDQM